jgi:hypothetical protein
VLVLEDVQRRLGVAFAAASYSVLAASIRRQRGPSFRHLDQRVKLLEAPVLRRGEASANARLSPLRPYLAAFIDRFQTRLGGL